MTKIDPDPSFRWSFKSQIARGGFLRTNERIRSRFLFSLREYLQEEMNFSFARIRLALVSLGEPANANLSVSEDFIARSS